MYKSTLSQCKYRLGGLRRLNSVRSLQTACTVHHTSFKQALSLAIKEASAPHYGFTSNDMPSHALVLVSRAYFPEVQADQYAQTVYSSIIEALGDDTIQVVSAVVDDVASTKDVKNAQGHPTRGVSLFLASEDEGASIHTFEDKVDRNISLGRAWKSQGDPANQETIDDGWVPTGDWKELLGGGGSSTSPSETTTIVPAQNVQSAILVGKGDFFAIDWPAQLFPKATVYGIPASITPFLTGYPITLSHNDKILKNGGVAIGFNRKQAQVHITHPRLKLLGEALTVTK